MNRFGVIAGGVCALALVAALVPAVASGASVPAAAPQAGTSSVDERKKPKPTKTPKPPKPKPTKSPTPSPSPSAPVPVQARAIEDWINAQPKTYQEAQSKFVYAVEPSLVGSDWERAASSGAKATFEVHQLLGQPVNRPIRVYLGWSFRWLEETVPRTDCPQFYPNQDAGACPPSNVIFTRFSGFQKFDPGLSPTSVVNPYGRVGISGLFAHEVAHLVQESLYPQRAIRSYPEDNRWLVEGWAMVVQTMAVMRVYQVSYSEARDLVLRVNDMKCEGVKLQDLLEQQRANGCEYTRGFLATEYLMWKTGDMKAGWTFMSQDASTSREAFSKAFSIDMDDFMDEADIYADKELALWPLRKSPS